MERNEIIQKLQKLTKDSISYLECFDTKNLQDRLEHQLKWETFKKRALKFGNVYREVGLVVKIDNLILNGVDYYNNWAVITKINKTKKTFDVVIEAEGYPKCTIGNNNIKWAIGTKDLDLAQLGKERHKEEVVKLINKISKLKKQ